MANDQTTSVESPDQFIWVFCGYGGGRNFPSGVFSSLGRAEIWITQHKLSGALTRYPVDKGVYDWAIANDFFKPSKPVHTEAEFIQKFSSASMEHYHYTDGTREGHLRSVTAVVSENVVSENPVAGFGLESTEQTRGSDG